jgi:hypothetical protein
MQRVAFSLIFAVLAFAATTGVSQAAKSPDADEVMVWTGAVALGLMAVFFIAYLIKRAAGLDGMPPPESDHSAEHH